MTPQDLLSFELLDINIVQELESVPNNTPAGELPRSPFLPRTWTRSQRSTLAHYPPAEKLNPRLIFCAEMTPCMSPLPPDGHLQDKSSPSPGLIQEVTEVINSIMGR